MFPLDHHPQSGNTESNAKLVFLDFRASIKINFSFAFRRFHNKKKIRFEQKGATRKSETGGNNKWLDVGGRAKWTSLSCLGESSFFFFRLGNLMLIKSCVEVFRNGDSHTCSRGPVSSHLQVQCPSPAPLGNYTFIPMRSLKFTYKWVHSTENYATKVLRDTTIWNQTESSRRKLKVFFFLFQPKSHWMITRQSIERHYVAASSNEYFFFNWSSSECR